MGPEGRSAVAAAEHTIFLLQSHNFSERQSFLAHPKLPDSCPRILRGNFEDDANTRTATSCGPIQVTIFIQR